MPPGTSFSFRFFAFLYSTRGSAASTRGLEVIVSVAVMPTWASLIPVAGHTPSFGSTLGHEVYRRGFSGSSISRWDSTPVYFFGWSFGFTTISFFTSKWPSSVRAIIVDPSWLAFAPTSTVVQGMSVSSFNSSFRGQFTLRSLFLQA